MQAFASHNVGQPRNSNCRQHLRSIRSDPPKPGRGSLPHACQTDCSKRRILPILSKFAGLQIPGSGMDRSILTLILAVLLLEFGSGLQGVLIPLRAELTGFPMPLIGALGTSYYIGFVAGCLFLPGTIRRVGHIRTFAALAAIAGSTILTHSMTGNAYVWLGLRFVFGVCFAGLFMVIESWLNQRATAGTRGGLLGIYMIATWVGLIVGKMLLLTAPIDSFQLFALCAITISLALVPVALTNGATPAIPKTGPISALALIRAAPVALVGALFIGAANGAFWTFGPIFASAKMGSSGDVALFMSVCGVGAAVSQWPLGRISDRIDRRWALLGASLAAAAIGIALTLTPAGPRIHLLGLSALFGMGALPIYALCAAYANDRVKPEAFVEASSLVLLTFGLGAIFGPFFAGLIIGATAPEFLFAFTAGIHLSLAIIAAIALSRTPRVAEPERAVFLPQAPISHGTQVVANLVPTADAGLEEAPDVEGENVAEEQEEVAGSQEPGNSIPLM